MPIYCDLRQHNSFTSKSDCKKKQILIIIPKKFIKRAVDRNKLRRRIKAILHQYKINSCVVKYASSCYKCMVIFQTRYC